MHSSVVDAPDTIIRTIPSQDYTKYTRDDELVDARLELMGRRLV
ncbi:MAG: hypothetical protein WA364_09560 [Candidatus Nitrosopolaris sp.]